MYKLTETPELLVNDERVLVRRRSASLGGNTVVVDGIRVYRGIDVEFALPCTVQPVSGEELMAMPEGDRFDEQYWCYIDDAEQPTRVNDLIYRPIDNLWYVVKDTEDWNGSYTKLRMEQQDTGNLAPDGTDPLEAYDKRLVIGSQAAASD